MKRTLFRECNREPEIRCEQSVEGAEAFSFFFESALTLTAYLLHDGSARKWEQRLKPLGVGACKRWNLLVLPI